MTATLRLLGYETADGARNMAADEALLFHAEAGVASLRFYGWSPPTLSLGYFQPAAARLGDDRLARLPWVRRATGGATLIHDSELTYALALPAGLPWQTGQPWMPRFHEILKAALASLGADVALAPRNDVRGDVLCFQKHTIGDLICRDFKIGGSAQRKHRRSLLQHGSILLRQSSAAPALPGIFELTGVDIAPALLRDAIIQHFVAATGWRLESAVWTDDDVRLIENLTREKFSSASWNDKR